MRIIYLALTNQIFLIDFIQFFCIRQRNKSHLLLKVYTIKYEIYKSKGNTSKKLFKNYSRNTAMLYSLNHV